MDAQEQGAGERTLRVVVPGVGLMHRYGTMFGVPYCARDDGEVLFTTTAGAKDRAWYGIIPADGRVRMMWRERTTQRKAPVRVRTIPGMATLTRAEASHVLAQHFGYHQRAAMTCHHTSGRCGCDDGPLTFDTRIIEEVFGS